MYQQRGFDLGIFNKRVGPMWNDNTGLNGATVNQVIPIDPFNVTNAFFNYTIRKSHLAQTKLGLSVNNLFDQHNITSVTQATKGAVYAPGPDDTLGLLPGRSLTLTLTLAYSPGINLNPARKVHERARFAAQKAAFDGFWQLRPKLPLG